MDDIKTSVRARDLDAVQAVVASTPEHDVAAELVRLGPVDQAVLFRLLASDNSDDTPAHHQTGGAQ